MPCRNLCPDLSSLFHGIILDMCDWNWLTAITEHINGNKSTAYRRNMTPLSFLTPAESRWHCINSGILGFQNELLLCLLCQY